MCYTFIEVLEIIINLANSFSRSCLERVMRVYWCSNCNVPIIDQQFCKCGHPTTYITTDLRPMFPEEQHLMYRLTNNIDFCNKSIWVGPSSRYVLDGEVKSFYIGQLVKYANADEINNHFKNIDLRTDYDRFNQQISKFIEANALYANQIERASLDYIKRAVDQYNQRIPVVSFSGGKDSTVVSDLVRRSLSNPSIIHIFSDTCMIDPNTHLYIERFRNENRRTPLLQSQSDKIPMDLFEQYGPPSRVMNWCCVMFKTGPLNALIKSFSGNKRLLTFYGIRGSESEGRSDYETIARNSIDGYKTTVKYNSLDDFIDFEGGWMGAVKAKESPKIAKQVVTSPIFDWHDIDVWLYILKNGIDFNDNYRLGFSRVGCSWYCPNNSKWSEFLFSVYWPDEYKAWNNFLVDFAIRIGKQDPEIYVQDGKWKARQGGAGLDNKQIIVEAKPCVNETYARTFDLTRPASEELLEVFKPFGLIEKGTTNRLLNEYTIIDRHRKIPMLNLEMAKNSYQLKITAINPSNYRLLSQRIDCQIRKYQSCVGCLGCVSKCPNGAISIVDVKYEINDKKCTSCGMCITPWRGGCLMSKILSVKKG